MPLTAGSTANRPQTERDQLQKLNRLLAAVRTANPFYADKLRAAAIDSDIHSLDEFRKRVPFTLKQELNEDQAKYPPYGSNLTYPIARYTRFCQTSGTSGHPMRWLDTPETWDWVLSNWYRVFEAAGVGPGDRLFFAFSFGPFLGFWAAFEAATRLGYLAMPGGGMRSAARLHTLIETGATVLCCTPTYAMRLAEVAREEQIDLKASKIRTIIVAGEPGGSIAGTRHHLSELWYGAKIVDHHGMTEMGPVSYGCPRRPGALHVIESSYIAEVIDAESGQPVPRGVAGELVLTNLGRLGSPLVRYRTGDLVLAGPETECECGSTDMTLEGGILGRTDDMLVVRGVNVYPGAVDDVLRSCGGVAEYRVYVHDNRSLSELSVQVEPTEEEAQDPALVHRLEAALSNAFALRIPVSLVACGELPRFEMKARRWVR